MEGVGYKKHLGVLSKSNPEELEKGRQGVIHKILSEIVEDKKLMDSVNKYGHTVEFARGRKPMIAHAGYSHLEIRPEKGVQIVIEELAPYADHMTDTDTSRYPLYVRDGQVFFEGEEGREYDAAAAVRHKGIFGCNVDFSMAQDSVTILKSLEEALEEAISG